MGKIRRKKTVWGRFRNTIRKRLLSGLLVVVPLGITGFVLNFIYVITAGPLTKVTKRLIGEVPHVYVMALSVVLFLALLYLIGLITTAFLGRKLLNLTEAIIRRIPVVKTVYGATKQVVEAVSLGDGGLNYKSAVLVEFPNPGALSVGFVTGRIVMSNGVEYLKVFIPTTPNPTTGFFQMITPDRVIQLDMSVEDAVKFMMSCGIVSPEILETGPVGPNVEAAQIEPDDEEYDWIDVPDEEKSAPDATES